MRYIEYCCIEEIALGYMSTGTTAEQLKLLCTSTVGICKKTRPNNTTAWVSFFSRVVHISSLLAV